MRLADFILRDMETIVVQWEAFAGTLLPAAANMKSLALRDHAQQILQAVAKDLSTAQSREAQAEKSMGRAPVLIGAPETAAQTHALLRARGGFDINQLAAEYRALRASVLRLWMDECQPEAPDPDDVIRFNEAIDQALAESVGYFSAQVDQARNLLLGMLGHDMRSPLQTILMTAQYLAALNAGEQVSVAASRLIRSGARMQALLNDMLDFNRTRLGLGVNIAPTDTDLEKLLSDELDLLRAAHPDRRVDLDVAGDCRGVWDGRRLQQLLENLVLNAIKYGAPDAPVRVVMTGEARDVRFEVRNHGPAIERMTLARIFDPLQRGLNQEGSYNADGNLGLGLYIAREIAKAHGGEIEARSDEAETVFAVRLPRRQ
ncbi:Adaptive-response sensory-kinase SasA [Paraburkholderia domus]|uniref:histidine kinase n=1 Tax=Paraburkholderia domus TaxID=2793075 RepID=A0A9N8QUP8_9BURK|nr:sensor histidine kinase [Paraburkholderia domus]MBK5048272.1 sensor histidine kinase [Burkholderia sp. R-70006]MBK5060501.1 sensor histidine kinase [Burkholderia sp. R-70199]MBK5085525.1 sensor histidine kinase [Burkholderia sp. R-69927]MBK5121992.1 sensor histidine kinase [Burkholderia sp. R-69980]MBK5164709.1 sensor histidine kinase [Burkholderia sp. R-70211]MBK5182658.1 sensor histidine kinase [Burkholderia sp. R-69749]MCI0151436.1 sensor histidine kinase [Paraburkholderia sediminicola